MSIDWEEDKLVINSDLSVNGNISNPLIDFLHFKSLFTPIQINKYPIQILTYSGVPYTSFDSKYSNHIHEFWRYLSKSILKDKQLTFLFKNIRFHLIPAYSSNGSDTYDEEITIDQLPRNSSNEPIPLISIRITNNSIEKDGNIQYLGYNKKFYCTDFQDQLVGEIKFNANDFGQFITNFEIYSNYSKDYNKYPDSSIETEKYKCIIVYIQDIFLYIY